MASGYSTWDDDSSPSRQRMRELRQKFESQSNKPAESSRQRPNNRPKNRGQVPEEGQQRPGPSSQVQAMRQKFDAPSKQAEEIGHRSQKQRLSEEPGPSKYCDSPQRSGAGHQRPKSRGPVQELRQKYEALSDKSARSQNDGSSRGSPKQKSRRSGDRHLDPGPSGTVQEHRQKFEALSDKSKGSHKEGSRQGSRSRSQGSDKREVKCEEGPRPSYTSEPSFFDSLNEREKSKSFFDSLEQRKRPTSYFDSLEQRERSPSFFDSLEAPEPRQQSYFDSLEANEGPPSFSDVLSSTLRGDQLMGIQHSKSRAQASPHKPQPEPSFRPDQDSRSAPDKFFVSNICCGIF